MGTVRLRGVLRSLWALLLTEFVFWTEWNSRSVSVTIRGLMQTHGSRLRDIPTAYAFLSRLSRAGPAGCSIALPFPRTTRDCCNNATSQPRIGTIGREGSSPSAPATLSASPFRRLWQRECYLSGSSEGPRSTTRRWEAFNHSRADLGGDGVEYERRARAFSGIPPAHSYGGGHGYWKRLGEKSSWLRDSSPRRADWSCSRSTVGGPQWTGQSAGDEECYPRDMEAFQQALLHLDGAFLQIAMDTNGEILQSLGMLWRQRRLEQQQDEEQQQASGGRVHTQTLLYGSGDEAIVGRKSNMAFRARAYKTAYEILHRSRIPLYNIAEVLLLLREGGLLLRGEEAHVVKRGAFRSAVLQKIHMVMSHGIGGLIKKSRSLLRERALQDLTRLPGVTKRTAAELFDEHFIDNPQMLRDRLASLRGFPTEEAQCVTPRGKAEPMGSPEALPTADGSALAKIFPTELARACIMHADAFAAPMDTAEFDDWQQQLLFVQEALRDTRALVPELPLARFDDQKGPLVLHDLPFKFQALPVISLGGGIFRGANSKLVSLSMQISLLPSWTEEGQLPPALDHAVCYGGQGAGPEEICWLEGQWQQVTRAYRALRQELHSSVVEALKQRDLLAEIFSYNGRTRTTHGAGRLPWRQETYRLVSIVTVPPRAFPFATLAARCSASAYRHLQSRTQKRWGWSLTPSGLTASPHRKKAGIVAVDEEQAGTSASDHEVATEAASDEDLARSPSEGDVPSRSLGERASWVFDEQGVLRLLGEPLSMQERVGTAP